MGVLNCTPDSFSDGGIHLDRQSAVAHACRMVEAGASIIDVGGESTRPGAKPVPLQEELKRVIPIIEALSERGFYVSVDTNKSEVMRAALACGAKMINDVTALRGDARSVDVVAEAGCAVCLMHMQGTPETMQRNPHYENVVDEVLAFLSARVEEITKRGVSPSAIVLDPGIGFGKRLEHNLALLANLHRLHALGFPVLVGVSRKSFLGALTGSPVKDREVETAAANSIATFLGADILRVHDVPFQARAIAVASALADQR